MFPHTILAIFPYRLFAQKQFSTEVHFRRMYDRMYIYSNKYNPHQSLFNADIVIGSEADEDGTVVLMKGHVVSEYDAEKDRYTRTIKVIVGEQELEVPMLVETKT